MEQELKEKVARNAASGWCRCFKCDGIVRDTNTNCDKDRLFTCNQWYNGYRTALLALDDYKQQMMKDAVDAEVNYWNQRGLSIRTEINMEDLAKEGDKVKLIIIKDD